MKVRRFFVSNSSSSSFACEICGESGSGWDAGQSDVGMCNCQEGHLFCEEHLLPVKEDDIEEENEDEDDDYYNEFEDGQPIERCPICQLQVLIDCDFIRYVKYKYSITEETLLKEIRQKYSSYKEFMSKIR